MILRGTAILVLLAACGFAPPLVACPFCTPVGPSLARQRAASATCAIAETLSAERYRPIRVLNGADLAPRDEPWQIQVDPAPPVGTLALLFAERTADADSLRWSAVAADETSVAYFVQAPPSRLPENERLPYFIPFLEHANTTIAEDAYREFGLARFESVAAVTERFPMPRLRAWIESERVPQARKGFYGLVLGLAQDTETRRENARFLRGQIEAEHDDFRTGFDGLLGGYLLLEGEAGLEFLERRLLDPPQTPVGAARHALTALRFFHEFGRGVSPERQRAALAKLLLRPELADAVITDLARQQGWEFRREIVALYQRPKFESAVTRRAIVGYLRVSPQVEAPRDLERLRQLDPAGVSEAEAVLKQLGGVPAQ